MEGDLMKHATRVALVFVSFLCLASAALCQTNSAVMQQLAPSAAHPITCRLSFGPTIGIVTSVPTAPYSGVQEYSSVQTLADGTHISHKQGPEKIYRDSQGRTRTERALCTGTAASPDKALVEIRDPVSGFAYILDAQNQIAHRFALQVRHPTTPPTTETGKRGVSLALRRAVPPQDPSRPSMTSESLGVQTMEGIPVEGMRTTEIIPEGFEDNDRPITVVREVWMSTELKIDVLTKHNDPRNGEITGRLTNIDLSEPAPSLFQPPPAYKIVEETERVTLTFTRP
jgi:hypothetical protein